MDCYGRVKCAVSGIVVLLLLLVLSACAQAESATVAPTVAPAPAEPTSEPVAEAPTAAPESEPSDSAAELVRIEAADGPPFYARFGENETFSDGKWVAVVFYRSPDCIPADFNLNAFFDFPGESGPGAFACAPPTVDTVEYWANGPGTDPAPMISEMTGRGAVPVWFFAPDEMDGVVADGVVSIGELQAMTSRRVGTAATYTELLHPSQSNSAPLIQFTAEGSLDDGSPFSLDVSYGAPDVADHTTIRIE